MAGGKRGPWTGRSWWGTVGARRRGGRWIRSGCTDAGLYDGVFRWLGFKNESIRPMNINVEVWGRFIPSRHPRRWLADAWNNISFGARILAGIDAHVPPKIRGLSRVRIVATLYNRMYARTVTDYGARVGWIWLKLGGSIAP